MENKLEIFKNQEFGSVRILQEGEKYLFCAKDVTAALGYKDSVNAIKRHCKGVAKRHLLTEGGPQELSFIPEGDVYRLITHSKLPSAEKFEHWVFDEVLPCIRKHGGYMTESMVEQAMADFITRPVSLVAEMARVTVLLSTSSCMGLASFLGYWVAAVLH